MSKLLLQSKAILFCGLFGIAILLMVSNPILAQNTSRTITGTVTDDTGETIPGVNIITKGTVSGTVTDIDGKYEIVASTGDVLSFSFVGYDKQEVTVADQSKIDVVLHSNSQELGEVVVVGYGVRRKDDVTGSVSTVKASELTEFPVLDALQAVQGRAAGVDIQSNNGGEPGAPLVLEFGVIPLLMQVVLH